MHLVPFWFSDDFHALERKTLFSHISLKLRKWNESYLEHKAKRKYYAASQLSFAFRLVRLKRYWTYALLNYFNKMKWTFNPKKFNEIFKNGSRKNSCVNKDIKGMQSKTEDEMGTKKSWSVTKCGAVKWYTFFELSFICFERHMICGIYFTSQKFV